MTTSPEDQPTIKKNILIIDDHPFIIQGYKNVIDRYNPKEYEFYYSQAKDCESGYEMITNPDSPIFDIALLDISMPPYPEKGMHSGEDLAILLHEHMPKCKIVLLTMFTEILKIKNIIEAINPSGLVIKNDLTFEEMLFGFDKVLKNEIYYSVSIQKMMDQEKIKPIEIDLFDKQILYHMSKGVKKLDMPHHIHISLAAIERRKAKLKELLDIIVEDETDVDLINAARDRGLIF